MPDIRLSTRERILRATLEVVAEGGVAAVRNALVADRAGVSPGSLTYCFSSQAEYLREALLLYVREEVERMRGATDLLRMGELAPEEVAQMIEAMIGPTLAGREVAAQFELYLEASRDPALREAAVQSLAAYEELASAALAAAGVPEPDRHAGPLVALADGLSLRYLAEGRTGAEGIAAALLTYVEGARRV